MAPKRRVTAKRDEQEEHGIEDAFDATDAQVLRSSPRLKKKPAKVSMAHNKNDSTQSKHVNMKPTGGEKKPAKATMQGKKKDKEENGSAKPEQVVGSSNTHSTVPLPYVEVFLPDGRLARQCRASNECDGKFRFETVRWRMERHLKREHGLEVHIPLRKLGRPSKTESESREKAIESRVEKVRWHKMAKKRFEDKDRKFALNLKKTEELHRFRATEKWAKLKPEFRMLPKKEFVEKMVEQHMSVYLASSKERILGIQKRIDEGYEKHRRAKVLPAWLNVMMDDIEEEKMYTKKGKEPEADESNEVVASWSGETEADECNDEVANDEVASWSGEPEANESNEEVSSWDGEPCDRHSSKEKVSFDEQEDEGSKEEEEKSNRKSNKSSSEPSFGDMTDFALLKPKDAKENLPSQTRIPLIEDNAVHSVDTFGGFAMMSLNINVQNNEGVIMEHRQKLPIQSAKKTRVVIDVCSPDGPSHETRVSHKFIIENQQVNVVEEVDGRVVTSRANIAAARLDSNAEITFTSKRFKLLVHVDQALVYGILHNEANSRTLNLFGQWMEHILPSSILKKVYFVDALWYTMSSPVITKFLLEQFTGVDFSELVFCFWPVICRHHWSLFVLYVNRGVKLLDMLGKKHYLLYFDSLGLTNPFECLDSVQRALRCLAEITGDVSLHHDLLNTQLELQLKIVDAPQQPNSSDCGFYVMKYIRDLIAWELEDQPAGKRWLTKNWFEHQDVCQMKQEFYDWCMRCLAEN